MRHHQERGVGAGGRFGPVWANLAYHRARVILGSLWRRYLHLIQLGLIVLVVTWYLSSFITSKNNTADSIPSSSSTLNDAVRAACNESVDEYANDGCRYCTRCKHTVLSSSHNTEMNEGDTAVILFLHIQKVGGTSLWKALEGLMPEDTSYSYKPFKAHHYWYPWELESDRYLRLRSFDAIFGHFMFGIHNALDPSRGYCYITMFRHPVDRLISLWNFINVEYKEQLPSENYGIEQFLEVNSTNTFQYQNKDNGMVRAFCGPEAYIVPFRSLTEYHLDCAKRNLRDNFAVVMLLEQFEKSVQLLETVLNLQSGSIPRLKENVTKQQSSLVQREVVEKPILRLNELDIRLYNYATELFNAQSKLYMKWFAFI